MAGKTEEEVTKFANRLLEDWRKSTVDDCKVAERCITEDRERICKSRLKITKIEGFLKELESASFDQRETTKIEERDLKVDLHQSRKEHELEKIEKEKAFIKMATRRLTYDTERL